MDIFVNVGFLWHCFDYYWGYRFHYVQLHVGCFVLLHPKWDVWETWLPAVFFVRYFGTKNGSASRWHTLHFSVDNHLKNHCKKALMSHNFHKCVRCYSSSRNDSVRRWARCALPRLRTIRRVGSVRQSSADAATAGDSERCCCRLGRSRSISKFSALRAFHPMWPFTCHICARVLLWLLQLQQPKLCSDGRFLPSLSIVAA